MGDHKLVYIMGLGRSGSTLLAMLLNAHPQMVSLGEVRGPGARWKNLGDYPCSCGVPVGGCPFWTKLAAAMRARGVEFGPQRWDMLFEISSRPAIRHLQVRSLRSNVVDGLRDVAVRSVPAWRARLEDVGRRNEVLIEETLAISGANIFVDATKDPIRLPYLARYANVDPWVVHLVRDAPGYAASLLSSKGETLEGAIRGVLRSSALVERLRKRLPANRVIDVRYEDLCRDPERQLARITDTIGVAPLSHPVDFTSTEHHVIGNRMRNSSSSEIRLDERWRERLDADQVEEILRRTEPVRRRYGYV